MPHQLFSETDDWEIEDEGQDVRGWNVLDEQGQSVGTVSDMIVDTDTQTIDRLVLDNGQEVDVNSVSLADGTVSLGGMSTMTDTTSYDDTSYDTGTATTVDTTDTGYAATSDTSTANVGATGNQPWRLRRHEEELRASKQRGQVGEVQISKDVVEEERTIDVPVTREEVEVRRVAVDRPAAGAQITDDGDTIRIPVTAEQVQVSKEARVVEEVEIAKTEVTDTQRVSDTVRREEFDIDREGDVVDADRTGIDTDRTTR